MILETAAVVVAYLVGAIPFGLVIGRLAGADVRQAGSGNIGATNVGRVLGRKLGVVTLVCDVLKGFLPVWAAAQFLPDSIPQREWALALTGLAAVLGHMFPVYLLFKGGKGVATALGVFVFFSPGSILVSLLLFVGVVAFSGFVSAGSLAASALIPLWLWLLGQPVSVLVMAGVVVVLIWVKHRSNIRRLLRGEEKGWKKE